MFRKINLLVFITVNASLMSAQDADTLNKKISLLFMGDIMGHVEQILSAEDSEAHSYNYDDVFQYVKDEISEADVAVANFEVTLAGSPYSGYPTFSSPVQLAISCFNAGLDVFATANNHAADRSNKGILSTISRLDSLGIPHTGTFIDPAAKDSLYPMVIEKNGFSLALLNYTYGTNGIKVPPPVIVNMLEKDAVSADIEKAKSKNPDAIILFLHWGTEYDTIPSAEQKRLSAAIFRSGADIIIGSHPHVIQPMTASVDSTGLTEPVVWSMGNFVSNQRQQRRDGGAMICLELTKRGDRVLITEAGYILTWVYTPTENGRRKFFILPCSEYEDKTEFFESLSDYNAMMNFVSDARRLLKTSNTGFSEIIGAVDMWIKLVR
jgi:poly-gamma-glutamate synthesis protein (capsule biosynthesis protein)